jgi:hypothetical protein
MAVSGVYVTRLATLLTCVSCGGAAESAGEPTTSAESVPPSGFYQRSTVTVVDSCLPPMATESFLELVQTSNELLNVALVPPLRQDLRWRDGPTVKFADCASFVDYSITSRTADSFSAEFNFTWMAPAECLTRVANGLGQLPTADCAATQRVSWTLKEPCPTTQNGVHCD